MSEHPQNDYLSRALDRKQISETQYQAGRLWQGLHRAAERGDDAAINMLDALFLPRRAKELLRDVLGAVDDGASGVPSALAQAAAKRGGNPSTSSRYMKKLGRDFRLYLVMLARAFESLDWSRLDNLRERKQLEQLEGRYLLDGVQVNFGAVFNTARVDLGGVQVSTPASDKRDARLGSVQALAVARGLVIDPSDESDKFNLYTRHGVLLRFDANGIPVPEPLDAEGVPDYSLSELEDALKRVPVKPVELPRRKRGARGRAPVTMPVLRSILQDDAKRLAEEVDEQKRRRKIVGARTFLARRLQTLARSKEARGGGFENLLKSICWVNIIR